MPRNATRTIDVSSTNSKVWNKVPGSFCQVPAFTRPPSRNDLPKADVPLACSSLGVTKTANRSSVVPLACVAHVEPVQRKSVPPLPAT